jgi:biotin carboxyl carrier protein
MTPRLRSGQKLEITRGERRYIATVVRDGRRTWVHAGGHVFVIDPSARDGRRAGAASTQDALSPPMPATVTKINVSAGDSVKDGDVILLLEAMKMELPIRAPHDGVIKRINCKTGELVQPGAPLVELE